MNAIDIQLKPFMTLVANIVKKIFYNQEEALNEAILENLFSGSKLDKEAINSIVEELTRLLKKAGYHNWDSQDFMKELIAKKLPQNYRNIFQRFWNKEKDSIHEALAKKSIFNNTLKNITWRVDLKTRTRHVLNLNDPVAIVEFKIGNVDNVDDNNLNLNDKTVLFECDKNDLQFLVKEMKEIHNAIQNFSSQNN
ncbi:comm domain-containing protein [Anaeramoeba ignava]|uniref:COMM domain-containing protein 1 n=1 Tax=Anaeramoeba ignava TaxID=1746090 RepID=A0A9Q0RED2_ANAIG|nr:comm domain-containing protein [Anaeramoeba ignava]